MKKSLSQQVYDGIVEEIIRGKIDQDAIFTEKMFIHKFGISKSPVREALIRLCSDDILISIPRVGYRVKIVDQAYLRGIIQFRFQVEPAYLDTYFHYITKEDIARIEKSIVVMDKHTLNTPAEYWRKTSVFHLKLAYSYRDKFFYDMLSNILNKQLITFSKLYWNNWSTAVDSKLSDNHAGILQEIKNGDRLKAVELLKKDIQSF